MDTARRVYRGTTIDWPGNLVLQQIGRTPTTSDPLIATLFALECCRHGQAVVYSASLSDIAELISPPNVLGTLEREIVVNVPPRQFIREFCSRMTTVETARQVLVELNCPVPALIADRYRLQKLLEDVQANQRALSLSAIKEFDERVEARQ